FILRRTKMLNLAEIQALIKTLDNSSIEKFEYECDEYRLSLKKGSSGVAVKKTQAETVVEEEAADEAEEKELIEITAPMVGTFYSATEPGAEPFVKVGSKIDADSVICILEAMKLFTEVEADVSGEIVEILAKDGDLVEYGQSLFSVKAI
ncbi:MAG: acetyl-CoA carboxylase biotin carboxyl carrier protein, partial [Enterococcus thailandicus]|nr:acetyl-CoA carboxylase biotin carboxyl carrier protein [Enterococcus thailandicus]